MQCPGHVVAHHALMRYCVECGGEINRRSTISGLLAWSVDHHPETLTCYLGLVCVISRDGILLCCDSEFQPLIPHGVQVGEHLPTLSAGDGSLYLSGPSGVRCLDLIALLQRASFENVVAEEDTLLTTESGTSPVTVVADSAFCIVGSGDARLACWTGQRASWSISLPDLRPDVSVMPPSIAAGYAFIVQLGRNQVHIADLQRKGRPLVVDCGGSIVFAVPTANGMAILVDTGKERRIVSVNPTARMNVMVPALGHDVTWIGAVSGAERHLWGDGSACFIQTPGGRRKVQVHGNVGVARVQEGRGWALLETAENCSAIAIDLDDAQVQKVVPLGAIPFTDFAVCGGRVIASNGCEIRSVALP
jgi:hypothetical protein